MSEVHCTEKEHDLDQRPGADPEPARSLQGYLAHKKHPPPSTLGSVLGFTGLLFGGK